jgi:hypothetical protein
MAGPPFRAESEVAMRAIPEAMMWCRREWLVSLEHFSGDRVDGGILNRVTQWTELEH